MPREAEVISLDAFRSRRVIQEREVVGTHIDDKDFVQHLGLASAAGSGSADQLLDELVPPESNWFPFLAMSKYPVYPALVMILGRVATNDEVARIREVRGQMTVTLIGDGKDGREVLECRIQEVYVKKESDELWFDLAPKVDSPWARQLAGSFIAMANEPLVVRLGCVELRGARGFHRAKSLDR